jgi:hypothetical protein
MKPDPNNVKKALKDLSAQVAEIKNSLAKTRDAVLAQLADVRSSKDTPCAQKPDGTHAGGRENRFWPVGLSGPQLRRSSLSLLFRGSRLAWISISNPPDDLRHLAAPSALGFSRLRVKEPMRAFMVATASIDCCKWFSGHGYFYRCLFRPSFSALPPRLLRIMSTR